MTETQLVLGLIIIILLVGLIFKDDEKKVDKYISLKVVEAEPMTLNEFRFTFERDPAPGKDGSTEGYMIHYRDGYTSWCPKETFEADYQKIS